MAGVGSRGAGFGVGGGATAGDSGCGGAVDGVDAAEVVRLLRTPGHQLTPAVWTQLNLLLSLILE